MRRQIRGEGPQAAMPSRSRGPGSPRPARRTYLPRRPRIGRDHDLPNPAVIQQTVQLLYGPNSQTPMTPTPTEIRRQEFVARWIGQYTVGPLGFRTGRARFTLTASREDPTSSSRASLISRSFRRLIQTQRPLPANPYANTLIRRGRTVPAEPAPVEQRARARLERHVEPWFRLARSANPSDLDLRLQHKRRRCTPRPWVSSRVRERSISSGSRTHGTRSREPMGSGKVIVTFQGLINTSQLVSPVSKLIS